MHKVVVIVALEGQIRRGHSMRIGTPYLKYSQATWERWCAMRGIHFLIARRTNCNNLPASFPPTLRRWNIPREVIERFGTDTRMALVDADTMIRWDAPDFFELCDRSLAAARGTNPGWIQRSMAAFQPLFPDVSLPIEEYFNAGVVMISSAQLPTISAFMEFCCNNYTELDAIMHGGFGDVGTDQTPLNLFFKREGESIMFLPRVFNLLHCFGYTEAGRIEFEFNSDPDWTTFPEKVYGEPSAFAFIEAGYIWHFTNTIAARERVMAETWRRVRAFYCPHSGSIPRV